MTVQKRGAVKLFSLLVAVDIKNIGIEGEGSVPGGGIDFMNRGEMGSGHGWAIGWAVAWNCTAKSYLNQQPPGAANWVIGSQGEPQKRAMPFENFPLVTEGFYDSPDKPISPASLYLMQLSERLGPQVLKNIGYSQLDLTRLLLSE